MEYTVREVFGHFQRYAEINANEIDTNNMKCTCLTQTQPLAYQQELYSTARVGARIGFAGICVGCPGGPVGCAGICAGSPRRMPGTWSHPHLVPVTWSHMAFLRLGAGNVPAMVPRWQVLGPTLFMRQFPRLSDFLRPIL